MPKNRRKIVGLGQAAREGMLFENRRITPAGRSIKLRNQWRGVFDADLIDPIFKAVEGREATIRAQA